MHDARRARLAPIAGIVSVALIIVGAILTGDQPGSDDSLAKFVSYYSDSGNQDAAGISWVLWAVAGLLLLWFLWAVSAGLRRAEDGRSRASTPMFGAAIAFVVLLWGANAAGYAYMGAANFFDNFQVNAENVPVAMSLASLSYSLLSQGSVAAAVLLAAASVSGMASGLFSRWLVWLGFVLAVVSLLGAFFVLFAPLLLWTLVVSILLLVQRPAAASVATPGAE